MPTRRQAIAAGLAAALAPRLTWAEVGRPSHLACARDLAGAFWLAGLFPDGSEAFRLPLTERGHAGAVHPTRAEAVVFARRPGTYALVLDAATGGLVAKLAPPSDRQFSGHGAYLFGGTLLCTSEVVAEGSAGRIGLWAADEGYRRIGEWETGGIGPHEVIATAPNRLIVANGGIETDPQDRTKLNLDRMQPSLVELSDTGEILALGRLPQDLHQVSIRHLALLGQEVAFATQWEGDPATPAPILGLWTPGQTPFVVDPPETEVLSMAGYGGSIATVDGQIAVTSPKGGAVQLFDHSGKWRATHHRADICGLAASAKGFIASDGLGALWKLDSSGLQPYAASELGLAWDNHIVAL